MKGKGSGDIGGKRFLESENNRGNECIKAMRTDRFDELPDSLLIHILSFLSLKEAAITSVLSKRWEFLWAELPRLEFPGDTLMTEYPSEKVRDFVGWVNRTLAIRTGNYLEKFDVVSLYHKTNSADVDAWVHFATKHKVKFFGLRFSCPNELYRLNQEMYSCASLTSLHLVGCFLDCKATIQWHSLTNLNLHKVYVDQALLDEILSTCFVLCTLILRTCRGFDRLDINSPRLRSLSIAECKYKEDTPPLKISAPYIHYLEIDVPMSRRRKLQVGNIPSLVRLNIVFEDRFSWVLAAVFAMDGAYELLESFQHVKKLEVGLQLFQVVALMGLNEWQLPHSRRELLVVTSHNDYEHSVSGIICLLDSSPNLETLIIEGPTEREDFTMYPPARDDLAGDLLCLKILEVRNYADSKGEPMLTLSRILLKRATALEEILVRTDVEDSSDMEEMVQTMLTYPRSSTKAVVRLVK